LGADTTEVEGVGAFTGLFDQFVGAPVVSEKVVVIPGQPVEQVVALGPREVVVAFGAG
jgi:hypothetical protein